MPEMLTKVDGHQAGQAPTSISNCGLQAADLRRSPPASFSHCASLTALPLFSGDELIAPLCPLPIHHAPTPGTGPCTHPWGDAGPLMGAGGRASLGPRGALSRHGPPLTEGE